MSTINAGLVGLMQTLTLELAPIRVNSLHPGIIGDWPAWANNRELIENVTSKTPTGQLACTEDVVNAALFLMDNVAVNDMDLFVDGGMRATPLV